MLDSIDLKILNILKANARISVRKIAKEIGVSPASVSRRIKRLESLGIIKGYVTITDDMLLNICSLMLMIDVDNKHNTESICREIIKNPEVCMCLRAIGTYNIVALAACKDMKCSADLVEKIKKIPGVQKIEQTFIIDTYRIMGLDVKDIGKKR